MPSIRLNKDSGKLGVLKGVHAPLILTAATQLCASGKDSPVSPAPECRPNALLAPGFHDSPCCQRSAPPLPSLAPSPFPAPSIGRNPVGGSPVTCGCLSECWELGERVGVSSQPFLALP